MVVLLVRGMHLCLASPILWKWICNCLAPRATLPNEDKERLALTLSTCLPIRIDCIDFQLSVSMVSKDNGPVYVHYLLLGEESSTLAFMPQM